MIITYAIRSEIMKKLNHKYVLHIPLYKNTNGNLEEIEMDEILKELIERLDEKAHDSFYFTKVESHYKKRSFDELLLYVFSDSEDIEEIFRMWFVENNHILGQEAFGFEHNNTLCIEDLSH
jgi:hypothetical protein